jgi:DNA-directed RNA polymerase subunit D
MKFKVLESHKDNARVLIEETSPSFMNSIRRSIMSEVPVLAVEDVFINKNSSALYDEMIAHRLGLTSISTPKLFNFPDKCKCKGKGCARCQVRFKLKKVGPITVYAEDLKSTNPKVKPAHGKTPIVKLLEDQELILEAVAVLGVGKKHAKWSSGLASYQYVPIIKINNAKHGSKSNDCVTACPTNVLEIKKSKTKMAIGVVNGKDYDCILCKACEDACKYKAVHIDADSTKYLLNIESWGPIKPMEMLKKAIDINLNKLKQLKKAL